MPLVYEEFRAEAVFEWSSVGVGAVGAIDVLSRVNYKLGEVFQV